jgi:PAS domain S-box-containing protein
VQPLRVQFSEVRIGDKSLDPGLASFIEAKPQTFEAKFSALWLARGHDVQYRYRFAGFDDRWHEGARPEARFDYPRPGRYRLEVQARAGEQRWSEPPVTLALEVRPRWYETLLFRGLLLALGCAALGALEKLRRKKKALKRIVEQRTAELGESEERFRNMADNAPVMIWVCGADRRFTFFNKTWLSFTGGTNDRELGKGWIEGVHSDDLDYCVASYNSAFKSRLSFQTEFRRRRSDGEYRWVLCTGVPRFASGGYFSGYIGSEIDITVFKRAQEDAIARHKLESLGVLAGGIAHDFNNLLGSILAQSELVLAELPRHSAVESGVHAIRAVANRASEIVRQLMAYAGQETASLDPVDVSALVGEMLHFLRVSISKRAKLKVELTSRWVVLANAAQLRQVVMNLITNASEALGEREGEIAVRTTEVSLAQRLPGTSPASLPPGDYVQLEVSDTGIGMTAEVQGKIFDPFFSTKFAGRGLGLAAVQGIVRSHGGAIGFVSAAGQGTRFWVLLPRSAESILNAPKIPDFGATISRVRNATGSSG